MLSIRWSMKVGDIILTTFTLSDGRRDALSRIICLADSPKGKTATLHIVWGSLGINFYMNPVWYLSALESMSRVLNDEEAMSFMLGGEI